MIIVSFPSLPDYFMDKREPSVLESDCLGSATEALGGNWRYGLADDFRILVEDASWVA